MARLPRALQPILTILTGKAALAQRETFRFSAVGLWTISLLIFVVGVCGAMTAIPQGGLVLASLPLFWLLATSSSRAGQTTFMHHGAHGTVSKNRYLNDLLAETMSVIFWLVPLGRYRRDHRDHHAFLATGGDPDLYETAEDQGFLPGWKPDEYWRHLSWRLVSPQFYVKGILTRLHANLIEVTGSRRAASWAFGFSMLVTVSYTGTWIEWLVAYVFPVVVLFQAAGLVQLISEHTYVHVGRGRDPKRLVWTRLTIDRFFGEMPPESGAALSAWARWWFRMLFVHFPARLLFVPLDLPSHSWHHANPLSFDWVRAPFARREYAERTVVAAAPLPEVWGLGNALSRTFDHLAVVPPDADLRRPESYGWLDPKLLYM